MLVTIYRGCTPPRVAIILWRHSCACTPMLLCQPNLDTLYTVPSESLDLLDLSF